MKHSTKSLLEEINSIGTHHDNVYLIENTASNVIASAVNLISLINETYDADVAHDLTKRLINSIKTQDPKKFHRGVRKINDVGSLK
jgi:hypothetical protein